MRPSKKIIIGVFLSIFMVFNPCISSTKIDSNNQDIDFSLEVEKINIGWKITTTLIYNGNGWLYVEKDGYGDIGCVIYDENDNKVWWTYSPEEGGAWAIGSGAKYESMTIWTGKDLDKNKLPKGNYKIVGAAGYFEGEEYIPLTTDPKNVELTKSKSIFDFYIFSHLFRFLQLININFVF